MPRSLTPLSALSPLDGRYALQVDELRLFFSEEALLEARVAVEVRYFIALSREGKIHEFPPLTARQEVQLLRIPDDFDVAEATAIKRIEEKTKHDVKAVEYFLASKIAAIPGLRARTPFLHFGLTSEDVNNLAYGLLLHGALREVIIPHLRSLIANLRRWASRTKSVSLLSLTHGQPATPTTLGKEFAVFAVRLERQLQQMKAFRMQGKFGGAVGNFAAHTAAYPDIGWEAFGRRFVRSLGLEPLEHTTQINPHDDLAELSHLLVRVNTILLDLSRDLWLYISRGVFRQKALEGEVGSSTMPHKVNPIDFENAEGNLGLSTALFSHFAEKLPISRLQRDLSDSTVQRSLGSAFGYHLLAVRSLQRGLGRIAPDRAAIKRELRMHPEVLAEAIQTVLRKHGISDAYERLKALTRGERMTREKMEAYIAGLPVPRDERERLRGMLP